MYGANFSLASLNWASEIGVAIGGNVRCVGPLRLTVAPETVAFRAPQALLLSPQQNILHEQRMEPQALDIHDKTWHICQVETYRIPRCLKTRWTGHTFSTCSFIFHVSRLWTWKLNNLNMRGDRPSSLNIICFRTEAASKSRFGK